MLIVKKKLSVIEVYLTISQTTFKKQGVTLCTLIVDPAYFTKRKTCVDWSLTST
jgi:hypothetical protein